MIFKQHNKKDSPFFSNLVLVAVQLIGWGFKQDGVITHNTKILKVLAVTLTTYYINHPSLFAINNIIKILIQN